MTLGSPLVSPDSGACVPSADRCSELVGVPRAFGMLVGHSPSAILSLPAFVSRSPPDNSCMYPSLISRSLCSTGIRWCTTPLAQSRNETNSSWVNGADKLGFIFQVCASGAAVQARFVGHNQTEPLPPWVVGQFDCGRVPGWQTSGRRRIFGGCEQDSPSCYQRRF